MCVCWEVGGLRSGNCHKRLGCSCAVSGYDFKFARTLCKTWKEKTLTLTLPYPGGADLFVSMPIARSLGFDARQRTELRHSRRCWPRKDGAKHREVAGSKHDESMRLCGRGTSAARSARRRQSRCLRKTLRWPKVAVNWSRGHFRIRASRAAPQTVELFCQLVAKLCQLGASCLPAVLDDHRPRSAGELGSIEQSQFRVRVWKALFRAST